jgi:hypothetical protein
MVNASMTINEAITDIRTFINPGIVVRKTMNENGYAIAIYVKTLPLNGLVEWEGYPIIYKLSLEQEHIDRLEQSGNELR